MRIRREHAEAESESHRRAGFLMVLYYVIGAVSLESAILGQYAEYLRTLRPDIPPAERRACGTDDVPEPGR
jgi:hypothetical protein